MNRGITRFIPLVFVIIMGLLVIAAVVSVARMFFGNTTSQPAAIDVSNQALVATDVSRSVRMTVRGRIVGDETFRSYRVTVSPMSRNFTRYKGYLEQPLVSKEYDNNTRAYEEFVYALSRAGLTKGTALSGADDDTRGICAIGVVYEFEIVDGTSVVKRLWTTSCSEAKGSLVGNVTQLRQFFVDQIPDAPDYIGKD